MAQPAERRPASGPGPDGPLPRTKREPEVRPCSITLTDSDGNTKRFELDPKASAELPKLVVEAIAAGVQVGITQFLKDSGLAPQLMKRRRPSSWLVAGLIVLLALATLTVMMTLGGKIAR